MFFISTLGVRLSGVRGSVTKVHIRKFYKICESAPFLEYLQCLFKLGIENKVFEHVVRRLYQ